MNKSCIFFLLLLPVLVFGQDTTARLVSPKKLIIATGITYTLSLVALSEIWYSQSPRQSFSFFNDWHEWKQIDKAGHFFTAFHLSAGTSQILKNYNLPDNKADAWGAFGGFLLLLPIEILDGFSAGYGASLPDAAANLSGAAFYYLQARIWNEIRLQPKFSFHRTPYPRLRDDNTLGNGVLSEILKDYNGQTYWLSINMDRFVKFPRWINLALGYGATGMVYARDEQNEQAGYQAYREFYLGLDIDLSHIKTTSKALNTLLFFVNTIRLPAPAIRFSSAGNKWHWLMF